MKNNFYSNLKNKIKNTKYDFAKNFWYHLICPLVIVVLGVVLALCVNFNLGIDFKGGTVATVVVQDQDLDDAKVYKNTKTELDKVLKNNEVCGLVYQKVETQYHGNAITVKFERISDELKEKLRNDLIIAFHSDKTESDQLNFVKVDNFEKSVDNGVMLSTALGVLIAIVCVTIYLWLRFGVSAGFITLIMALLDNLLLMSTLAVTRVRLETGTMAGFGFVTIFSIVLSAMFFSRMNDNIKQEKYAKSTKYELANETAKSGIVINMLISLFLLILALMLDVVPVYMISSTSLPLMLAVLIPFLTSMYVTPGLWARTYLKRKLKKSDKDDKKVVVEEPKLTEEDITKAPEVIVETEAKEEN